MPDWVSWPRVPKGVERPQDLYVAETIEKTQRRDLEKNGWNVVDVRVLPARSDGDRAFGIKAWLHGVRVGSIVADKDVVKIIDLEARAYGLVGSKQMAEPKEQRTDENFVIDELLDFRGVTDAGKRVHGGFFSDMPGIGAGEEVGRAHGREKSQEKKLIVSAERDPDGKINHHLYEKSRRGRPAYKRKVEPFLARRYREEKEKREAEAKRGGHPTTAKFAPTTSHEFREQVSDIVGNAGEP